ncbi:MAG: hypothetical protein Q4A74_02930 [Cardiobacteriaceae bacterium]|nr:hypothetical protein [Cardiobacteriaceae bacterium]
MNTLIFPQKMISLLGVIIGPKGFFGPGFWADFKEGWNADQAQTRLVHKTKQQAPQSPYKTSASENAEDYGPAPKDLCPEDIWDFSENEESTASPIITTEDNYRNIFW